MQDTAILLLNNWAKASEKYWTSLSGTPAHGTYGTGYNGWGTQTQQKYISALATLAHVGQDHKDVDTGFALERALAALRFNLHSHQAGKGTCTCGNKWGHTWISALGVERMMFAVELLRPHLDNDDLEALRMMLCSEAEWLLKDYQRGAHKGITAGLWGADGHNDPESNIWNGALLWRTAQMYPDHKLAEEWKERACEFLINGVSISTDLENETIVDGKPVKERCLGANFFPRYALDHHGYLNVGYMAICASNAAILHFDLKKQGLPQPESLHHHQQDLWQELRRMVFPDGRLLRVGGDTRIRYAYCQEYLLPSLLYAADHHNDAHALELAIKQINLISREADYSGDGSFYGKRLAKLAQQSPGYYTRLESDRANGLAMYLAYLPVVSTPAQPKSSFEESVAGSWVEYEYGAAMQRSSRRVASFAWRAHGLAQGLCLPPHRSDLAEWEHNLTGSVDFLHFANPLYAKRRAHRKLLNYTVSDFEGGFITSGSIMEGVDIEMAEGWGATDSAEHRIAFAALPDDSTVVGLQYCKMGNRRGYLSSVKGLRLNIPNDLYNNHQRTLRLPKGEMVLTSPPCKEETQSLGTTHLSIEGEIGLIGIYGGDELTLARHSEKTAGKLASLHLEEVCYPLKTGPYQVEAGEMILDTGWAVVSQSDGQQTQKLAQEAKALHFEEEGLRGISIVGTDGKQYYVLANFGNETLTLNPSRITTQAVTNLVTDATTTSPEIRLPSLAACILEGKPL